MAILQGKHYQMALPSFSSEAARKAHNFAQESLFNQVAESFLSPIPNDVVARTERIVRMASLCPGQAILDVGTGTGVMLPYLLRAGAGRIMACDLSAEMLKLAKQRFPTGVAFIQSDVVDLPVEGTGKLDRVICNAVFANFYDQRRALLAIRRLLKPRGLLIVSHPMGRAFVSQLRAANPSMVKNDLPAFAAMVTLCSITRFRLLRFVDEPALYVALIRPDVGPPAVSERK